jgi:CRISPR-associated protein Csm3
MERVPAGAIFDGAEMVFSLYEIQSENGEVHKAQDDLNRLDVLLEAMRLVEEDYLGGLGSRGSGKIKFRNIQITFRGQGEPETLGSYPGLDELTAPALRQAVAKIQLK